MTEILPLESFCDYVKYTLESLDAIKEHAGEVCQDLGTDIFERSQEADLVAQADAENTKRQKAGKAGAPVKPWTLLCNILAYKTGYKASYLKNLVWSVIKNRGGIKSQNMTKSPPCAHTVLKSIRRQISRLPADELEKLREFLNVEKLKAIQPLAIKSDTEQVGTPIDEVSARELDNGPAKPDAKQSARTRKAIERDQETQNCIAVLLSKSALSPELKEIASDPASPNSLIKNAWSVQDEVLRELDKDAYATKVKSLYLEIKRDPRTKENPQPFRRVIRELVCVKRFPNFWARSERERVKIDNRIKQEFSAKRNGEATERPNRKKDELTERIRKIVLEIIEGAYRAVLRDAGQAKGGESKRRRMHAMTLLNGIVKEYREKLETAVSSVGGEMPSLETIYKWLDDACSIDRFNDIEPYRSELLGNNVGAPGQNVGFDASGVPQVWVNASVMDCSEGRKPGEAKRWMWAFTDMSSGRFWMNHKAATSENEGWPAALENFVSQLNHAPENFFCDRGGGVIEPVFKIRESDAACIQNIKPSVLKLLAMGINLRLQKPGNPRGKAFVESSIGVFKNKNYAELWARARVNPDFGARIGKGGVLCFDGVNAESNFDSFMETALELMNSSKDFRGTEQSRIDLWNSAEGVAYRESRALIQNHQEVFEARMREITVTGLRGNFLVRSSRANEPLAALKDTATYDGCNALLIPFSLRACDVGRNVGFTYIVNPHKAGSPQLDCYEVELAETSLVGQRAANFRAPVGRSIGLTQTREQSQFSERERKISSYKMAAGAEGFEPPMPDDPFYSENNGPLAFPKDSE